MKVSQGGLRGARNEFIAVRLAKKVLSIIISINLVRVSILVFDWKKKPKKQHKARIVRTRHAT